MWLAYAVGSAFFAGVTSILAKCGIKKTDATVATAVRTVVILIFSWIMVGIAGSWRQLGDVDAKTMIFLILSGGATGASWLCYFKALQLGDINKVVPINTNQHSLNIAGADFSRGRAFGAKGNCCFYDFGRNPFNDRKKGCI